MRAEQPHRTLAGSVEVEIEKVKGSRFLAVLVPVADPEDAKAAVEELRAAHPDASHHCWAWRLGDGREQCSDDGEPRDSAGAPILRHLGGADLVDVLAVVVRWFGGTKLGRGGLVRAYGAATAAAIAGATLVDHAPVHRFRIRHAYELTGPVDGVLHAHGANVLHEVYVEDVTRLVEVPAHLAGVVERAMVEATAGQVEIESPS